VLGRLIIKGEHGAGVGFPPFWPRPALLWVAKIAPANRTKKEESVRGRGAGSAGLGEEDEETKIPVYLESQIEDMKQNYKNTSIQNHKITKT
jgi:hypothetical protein